MSVRNLAKHAVDSLPGPVAVRLINLSRRTANPVVRHRLDRRASCLRELGQPTKVMSGPFQGMPYLCASLVTDVLPKVLGTYEREIHSTIDEIVRFAPDVIVNVGAAEGYYASGLARLIPDARVVAFELRRPIRYLLREQARASGVLDRVTILGAGSPERMEQSLASASRPLVVSDCEGYEDILLDPSRAPTLTRSMVLVENHDQFVPGCSNRIRERFQATHDIRVFESRRRVLADAPQATGATPKTLLECMDEDRKVTQTWSFMTPRPATHQEVQNG